MEYAQESGGNQPCWRLQRTEELELVTERTRRRMSREHFQKQEEPLERQSRIRIQETIIHNHQWLILEDSVSQGVSESGNVFEQ